MSSQLQHRRTHNLLLFSKLLNGRDSGSPFTLIIDSLEQSGIPLVREMVKRAKTVKTKIIYVAFETLRQPKDADVFLPANELTASSLQKEIISNIDSSRKNLLILDALHPLLLNRQIAISQFLSSLTNPQTTLLTTFHADIPIPRPTNGPTQHQPPPSVLLQYLATTILTVHPLSHILAQKNARDRSLEPPKFGLDEGIEGVLQGLGSNDRRGVVVEMEYRRRSGRGMREWFFVPNRFHALPTTAGSSSPAKGLASVMLLEDHPLYRSPESSTGAGAEKEGMDMTFNLSLTAKQLKDREGVVLPYFDAQGSNGPGEGGRILYDMGVEDDFDDEEDEV